LATLNIQYTLIRVLQTHSDVLNVFDFALFHQGWNVVEKVFLVLIEIRSYDKPGERQLLANDVC